MKANLELRGGMMGRNNLATHFFPRRKNKISADSKSKIAKKKGLKIDSDDVN